MKPSGAEVNSSLFSEVPDKQKAWDDLLDLANNQKSDVNYSATSTLGYVFSEVPDKKKAWKRLHELTYDNNKDVKSNAALAIKSVFYKLPDKQEAWDDLVRLTSDNNSDVRFWATSALGSVFSDPDEKKELNDCDKLNIAIRSEEYRSLQDEHKQNRVYLFDKPLLIATAIVGVIHYIVKTDPESISPTLWANLLLCIFGITLLLFNLKISTQKLDSDARIIAYVQLFHENCSVRWIGWETSLRCYRKWKEMKTKDALERWLDKNIEREYIHSKNWFYINIFRFHVVYIIYLSVIWIPTVYNRSYIVYYVLILFVWGGLCLYIKKDLCPSNFEDLIEKHRAIWLDVYRKNWKTT